MLIVCMDLLSHYTFSTANWTAHHKIPEAYAIYHRRKVICFVQHDPRIPSTAHHVAHQWQEGEWKVCQAIFVGSSPQGS